MYFAEDSLQLWLTQQQLDQFTASYPNAIKEAYESAVGHLESQIGYLWNLDEILAVTDDNMKNRTIKWILQVLTAYYICSSSLDVSEPLRNAYEAVMRKIQELKEGEAFVVDAERKEEPNARGVIVSRKNQYIG